MLPLNILFVRHGNSEGNEAMARKRAGNENLPSDFHDTPDWQLRLTPKGRLQAERTGEWLRNNLPTKYLDSAFVSPYVRAQETAALLGLGLEWKINLSLSERDYGLHNSLCDEGQQRDMEQKRQNPLFHRMGQGTGQSMADVLTSSSYWLFDTLHREHSNKNVIAVCHGERMLAVRYIMERMTPEAFHQLMQSNDPRDQIFNCQVLHYTRVNPNCASDIRGTCDWYRSFCPSYEGKEMPDTGWREITRRSFSEQDLLNRVAQYPALLKY